MALIGLFNIIGCLIAGALGKGHYKKYLLSLIYTGRTIAAILFILLPITPSSIAIFSIVMGALWLATVPLTSGIIGHIYGCLLYTSPSPRDKRQSRMPSSA